MKVKTNIKAGIFSDVINDVFDVPWYLSWRE
jgi:hypothetical protein